MDIKHYVQYIWAGYFCFAYPNFLEHLEMPFKFCHYYWTVFEDIVVDNVCALDVPSQYPFS